MSSIYKNKRLLLAFLGSLIFTLFLFAPNLSEAATLKLSPSTGVYTVGSTFSARVVINTNGETVNASEGKLTFNTSELSVVSVSKTGSIFSLWTVEPSFSNSAGTIVYGGGSPSGYTGSAGNAITITFRAKNAGTSKVTFSEGSVLAADGLGTNVLTSMSGGTYTIGAKTVVPKQEYIAPPNTPAAPKVTSSTHPDEESWYAINDAKFSWALPPSVVSVRTLLDKRSDTIPTKVYETPISELSVDDLSDGTSYLHVQFKNSDGWGRVTHFRVGVDTENPTKFTISQPILNKESNPEQKLKFEVEDATSPVILYEIRIDGGEMVEFIDEKEEGLYTLPPLTPGEHSVVVEAYDSAGNSIVSTFEFTIAAFDKPVFTDYPTTINEEVIPVIKGLTRPNSTVVITQSKVDGGTKETTVMSNDEGVFIFIPDSTFDIGVYDLTAVATDEYGAQSDPSDTIRIVVEVPGYIKIGSFMISILSILVPVLALFILLIFGLWYLWHKLLVWRNRVAKETIEAENALVQEFDEITKNLHGNTLKLKKSRKGKLTKAEEELITQIQKDITQARKRVSKEIEDIEKIIE